MAAVGWRPTVTNYQGPVTKECILQAIGEGSDEAQLTDPLKKGEMAREAERLPVETGWLPEPLRLDAVDGEEVRDA